jgi:hypothetical protein
MASYRFRLVRNGLEVEQVERDQRNDLEAFRIAQALAVNVDVELSRLGFVAVIHKKQSYSE